MLVASFFETIADLAMEENCLEEDMLRRVQKVDVMFTDAVMTLEHGEAARQLSL